MADLLVQLAGGVRVVTGTGRDLRIASRKALAVLACLALRPGTAHARDFLAGLLWEDSDAELARSSLRQALAALRRALPAECSDALRSDASAVWLDADRADSDVAQLQALLRDASAGAVIEGAARCTGELFEGLDARSSAFERWMDEQRRAFRRQLLDALERAAAQCEAAGDLAGRVAALEQLTAMEPTNERAHRELMDCLARLGRYTDALRQYRTCRDALRRDLDVATEPATEALHREILRRRRVEAPSAEAPVDDADAPAGAVKAASVVATLRDAVVMVARIGGATQRGHEDPELVRRRWSEAEAVVRNVVERLGGHVDRPSQGEILAVFGLGRLTGNEAERAARAALELAMRDESGPAVRFAIGLAEGQVLPASGEVPFPLAGSPVERAQGLARAAPFGSVQVSGDIANRLSHRYRLEPSRSEMPGDAWRITDRLSGVPRERARPFAGRRAELAMLVAMLERVRASGRGRVVVVRGEPGIGKSALLDALANSASERGAKVHVLQVLDFGQASVERPSPALAMRLLGLGPGTDGAARAEAVAGAVAGGRLPADLRLPALDLIGAELQVDASSRLAAMDAPARERDRGRALHWLVGQSHAQPLLIVVEDVHWADPVELAQLGDLAAACSAQPLLLALSTRSEGDPVNAAWRARARGCPVTALDLAPLDDDEAREFAEAYAELPADVVERCLATAAGHPLFLEQLLRAAKAGQSALPGSVRGLVAARIEGLAPDCQRAVHAAAVLGVRFTVGALRHLLADPQCDPAPLETAGLIATEGEECRFAHALIRDAVYESLLGSVRRDLHRRAAAWYEARDAALHADHLAAAADPSAPAAHLRAAAVEMRAHRPDRALLQASRGRETARQPSDLFDACAMLGDVQLVLGRTDDAIASFRECVDLATSAKARARAWFGLATGLRIVDRYDEALAALVHAEQALGSSDPTGLARLWTLRGNLHFPRGALDDCLDAHRRALEFAERADSPEDVVRALGGLGDAHYQRGWMRTAHDEFRQCVALSEQHGFAGLRVTYLPMVAATQSYVGNFAVGVGTCERAIAAARELSDLRAELLANTVQAAIEINRMQHDAARRCSERSVELAREIGARRFEAEGLALHGLALFGAGDREAGRRRLEEAVVLARTAAPTYCAPFALGALALAIDDATRSRALLAEGERLLARGCVSHNHFDLNFHGIDVCLRLGDAAGARRHAAALEAYTRDEPLPWCEAVIARGRVLARVLDGEQGAEVRREIERAIGVAREMNFLVLVPALEEALTR